MSDSANDAHVVVDLKLDEAWWEIATIVATITAAIEWSDPLALAKTDAPAHTG